MASINKVFIVGRVSRDPITTKKGGFISVEFQVVCRHKNTDKDGNKRIKNEFFNCLVYGERAISAKQLIKKGVHISVEGKLQTTNWTEIETGHDRYKIEIICNNVVCVSKEHDYDE